MQNGNQPLVENRISASVHRVEVVEARDKFREQIRQLYLFYHCAILGISLQRELIAARAREVAAALEKSAGSTRARDLMAQAQIGFGNGWPPFAAGAKEFVREGMAALLRKSEADDDFETRIRHYALVLLAELWETGLRPKLKELQIGDASPFWASLHRMRNCILHNRSILDRTLEDQGTFGFLGRGSSIKLTRDQFDRIIEAAFTEVERMIPTDLAGSAVEPDKDGG